MVIFVGAPIQLPVSASGGHLAAQSGKCSHAKHPSLKDVPDEEDVGNSKKEFAPIIRLFRVACVLTAPEKAIMEALELSSRRNSGDERQTGHTRRVERKSTLQLPSGSPTTDGMWDPNLVTSLSILFFPCALTSFVWPAGPTRDRV